MVEMEVEVGTVYRMVSSVLTNQPIQGSIALLANLTLAIVLEHFILWSTSTALFPPPEHTMLYVKVWSLLLMQRFMSTLAPT
jgi:hypothetical protein